jgi:hypothetical protein
MSRCLAFIIVMAFIAGCANNSANYSTPNTHPEVVGVTGLGGFPQIPLPAAKAASTAYGNWEIVDSYNADFTGSMLVLKPVASDPWPYAWAIVDLGPQNPALQIQSLFFTTQADWGALTPPAYAWVGLSDYTRGTWMWRKRDSTFTNTMPTDFSDAPAGTQFFQNTDPPHAYMALVSNYNPVDFGEKVGVRLAPEIHLYQPAIGVAAGQNNKFMFNSANGTGDIITFCPGATENGGAVARLTIQPNYTINWEFFKLYETGKALEACFRYDMDYTSTGKLALLAARQTPSSLIRYITETDTAGTFNLPETVVDASDLLPATYTDPQFAMELDATNNPHIVFADNNDKLRYVFKISGAWGVTGGGYTKCTRDLDIAVHDTDIIACFCNTEASTSALGISSHPASSVADPWDAKYNVLFEPPNMDGKYNSMRIGPGNRVYIAQCILKNGTSPGGITPGLAVSYNNSGVLASAWTNASVDPGRDLASGEKYVCGAYCSLGFLGDGTPVIAYWDQDDQYLRMAIGSTVDGGPDWYRFIVDSDPVPSSLGRYTAVDVKPGTGSQPDLIGVAYEATTGANSSLRFAVIVWPPA